MLRPTSFGPGEKNRIKPSILITGGFREEEIFIFGLQKKIKLLGVDTPSVDLGVPVGEQMPIHQIILGNDISIIEGLANLNEITQERFYFIGLPLKIEDADGGPVRAIAIEQRPEV